MTTLPVPNAAIRNGQPLVSVVVPCYGEGRYLDDCLNSLRQQTYPHLEVLVMEDAGQTDALDVAMAHALEDERVSLYRTSQNIGLGAIRNLATTLAKGDLLFFLDGDDWAPPNSVRSRVSALSAYLAEMDESESRRIAGVFGQGQHAPFNAGPGQRELPCPALMPINLANSRGANVFIVSAPLVRRDILTLSGGFAEGVPGAEDHLCWMRVLALDTEFLPVERVVAFYRQKPTSMLRDSATTFAAFGIAARNWVATAVADLPSSNVGHPTKPPDLAASGERTMRWGRPRRSPTRMSATGVHGANRLPPITEDAQVSTTPPKFTSALMQPPIETAERFLAGQTDTGPYPATTALTPLSVGAVGIKEVDMGESNVNTKVAKTPSSATVAMNRVTLTGQTFTEGVVCVALGHELGLPVTLALDPAARKGAVMAVALIGAPAPDVVFTTPTSVEGDHLAVVVDSTPTQTSSNIHLSMRDARTLIQELLSATLGGQPTAHDPVLVVMGLPAVMGLSAAADASDAALAALADATRSHTIKVIDAATSRHLADASVPHQPATLADLFLAERLSEFGPASAALVELMHKHGSDATAQPQALRELLARLRSQLASQ